MKTLSLVISFVILIVSGAKSQPAGFEDSALITGAANPIAMAYAPDGRLFICERAGRIRIFKNGALLSASFAQINVSTTSERGLLGIAIDPAFPASPYVYIYYTTSASSLNPPATPKNRVSRLTANGDAAVGGSELILVDNIASDAGNHNAGCIRFGLDGKLYIATGDGGSTPANSQNLGNLSGKILRINKDGTIPPDNPFVGTAGARGEIYCYGLRNPFRFSFRPGTNVMYIADVGQNTWEEINVGQAGGNYGWPTHEGPTTAAGFISPIHAINHNGTGASITGGCFINNPIWPAPYQGSYYYGDYIDQYLDRLVVTANDTLSQALTFGTASRPVDFIQGIDGDLYYADLNSSVIRRVWYSGRTAGYTITTDRTAANGGETIEVNWAVPGGRPASDRVALYRAGEPNSTAPRWSHLTGGAGSGLETVPIPNEQGTFEIRYQDESGVVLGRSTHIVVAFVPNTYTLTPNATRLEAGRPLSISWTAPSGSSARDWIALYEVGAPNTAFLWWRYTAGAAQGAFVLTAPSQTGQYEFRYLLNNGYVDSARSVPITVIPPAGYSLAASPSAVIPGGQATVTWTAPVGSAPKDWIGLYRIGSTNHQYIAWIYTGGATNGSSVFTMPTQAGDYEFRYLLNNGYVELRATSGPVTVTAGYSLNASPSAVNPGGAVTVSWTAPAGSAPKDWIGLFRVGSTNHQYISWIHTGGATSGSHVFMMPAQTGQYEFRYLLNNGYTDLMAASNTVTVQ